MLVQTKEMATAQALENNGGEWGLTWYLWSGIYKTIPTWTHLQNPVAAVEVEALISKISSKKKHFSDDWEDQPSQDENNHCLWYDTGHPLLGLRESQLKLTQQHEQNFSMEGQAVQN